MSIRLLENIQAIVPFTCYPDQREVLLRQAAMIERASHESLPEESDGIYMKDTWPYFKLCKSVSA